MKIRADRNELYPVILLGKLAGRLNIEIEIDDELYQRYLKAYREFMICNYKLKKIYNNTEK